MIQGLVRGSERLHSRIKGTFIEKAVNYLKTVYVDYTEVAISVREDFKKKPVKGICVLTGFGVFVWSLKNNPSEQSFKAKHIECVNEVSLVPTDQVNSRASEHCKYVQDCYNKDLIRYRSLGVVSIVWVDKYSDTCKTFEANCSYLKVPYRQMNKRILDVGFWNIWWVMSRNMLDYDVNY